MDRALCDDRNTSTCVGKTDGDGRPFTFSWKHPHVRGEAPSHPKRNGSARETPPRAWGRRGISAFLEVLTGNTPTCVGKTRILRPLNLRVKKHPHVRGEDWNFRVSKNCASETPPRAWGRHRLTVNGDHFLGNTPTCVGKTQDLLELTRARQKHPHVRGEDWYHGTRVASGLETPPRAWGRLAQITDERLAKRNTPTCVGKTLSAGPVSF